MPSVRALLPHQNQPQTPHQKGTRCWQLRNLSFELPPTAFARGCLHGSLCLCLCSPSRLFGRCSNRHSQLWVHRGIESQVIETSSTPSTSSTSKAHTSSSFSMHDRRRHDRVGGKHSWGNGNQVTSCFFFLFQSDNSDK